MTRLFTFSCDDFILDEQGGIFVSGTKKFSLKINSPCLSKKMRHHVETKAVFFESEYPDSVVALLRRNNLLRLAVSHRREPFLKRTFILMGFFLSRYLSIVQRYVGTDFAVIYVVSKLRPIVQIALGKQLRILLSESVVTMMVRPWAWLLHPVGVTFFGIANALWFTWNFTLVWSSVAHSPLPQNINPFVVTISLLSLFILHELGHAASAYSITKKCGEIRVHRAFRFFPFLAVHLPALKECGRVERLAISASGPIFQISCAILCIHAFPQSNSIQYAANISIVIALVNFIPFKHTDGYWMLVELLNGITPAFTFSWSKGRKIDIIYTVILALFALSVVAVLFFLLLP